MEENISDYVFSDPYDAPVSLTETPGFLDLLTQTSKSKHKNTKGKTMDTTKKAFDLGAARAAKEFMKSAGILETLIGAQSKDPRKALAISTAATLGLAHLANQGLTGELAGDAAGALIGPGISKAIGALGGLGALGTAAYMGSTAPGLLSPTTMEQRVASEIAAKLQNPDTMGTTIKHLGLGGLAALAVPAAMFQLGKLKGESDSSFI